jgi:hypothetical protein
MLVFIAIVACIQFLPVSPRTRIIATIAAAAIVCIDVILMMIRIKKDERETAHEAIAERNAAWIMVAIIGVGVAYEAAASAVHGIFAVDPFLLAAVAGGLLAKMISNIYLDRRD